MARTLAVLASLAVLSSAPALAHAQRTTILRAEGTGRLPESAGAAALAAVEREARAAGLRRMGAEEDPEGLSAEILTCGAPSCVVTVLRALGLDFATVVAVWARRGEDVPSEVTISLVDGTEEEVQVRRPVGPGAEGSVDAAAGAAFREALAQLRRRHGAVLRVVGLPEGAAVAVGGRPVGRLPLSLAISPGPHEVTVSLAGYRTEHYRVTVPEAGPPETTVQVSLRATSATEAARAPDARLLEDDPPRPPRRAWLAGPILLGAGGAGALAVGIYGLAAPACRESSAEGGCLVEDRTEPIATGLLVGAGSLALAGSLTWALVHPRRARRAELGLLPGGAVLRGWF